MRQGLGQCDMAFDHDMPVLTSCLSPSEDTGIFSKMIGRP